ncbi:hypothetical protein NPIL_162441 [Nephila pilipes]|uniref:Uncharacterized protein n=1 Tax=Nephila pilipes TaxID=299642 RepID=A0A8X6PCZ6_NEPPI|nr:hypothetical protein NPIL_162441 [Nephila pilipes]
MIKDVFKGVTMNDSINSHFVPHENHNIRFSPLAIAKHASHLACHAAPLTACLRDHRMNNVSHYMLHHRLNRRVNNLREGGVREKGKGDETMQSFKYKSTVTARFQASSIPPQ